MPHVDPGFNYDFSGTKFVIGEQEVSGLGLEDVEHVGVIREDIGLKEPVLVLDYPSPDGLADSVKLTEDEIKKCRVACAVQGKRGHYTKKNRDQGGAKQKQNKTNAEYFVEFPDDEAIESGKLRIREEEEK